MYLAIYLYTTIIFEMHIHSYYGICDLGPPFNHNHTVSTWYSEYVYGSCAQ
jgi:hypothetical protein